MTKPKAPSKAKAKPRAARTTAGITPSETTGIRMELNLDSRVAVTVPAAGPRRDATAGVRK